MVVNNMTLPILKNKKYIKIIKDFIDNELDNLPTLNDIAANYVSFITEKDGERYSFTMIDDHVGISIKEDKDKNIFVSKIITIISDTFERTNYILSNED